MADKIKFSDLFEFNDSDISKIVSDLEKVNTSFEELAKTISAQLNKSLQGFQEQAKSLQSTLNPENVNKYEKEVTELATKTRDVTKAQKALADSQKAGIKTVADLKGRVTQLKKEFNEASASEKGLSDRAKQLNRDIKELQKTIRDTSASVNQADVAFKKQATTYNELTKQNQILSSALKNLNVSLDKNGKFIGKDAEKAKMFAERVKTNTTRLKQFDNALGRSFRNVGNYGSALDGARTKLISFASGLGLAIFSIGQIASALRRSAEEAIQFEFNIAKAGALAGATAKEVEELNAQAQELGATTANTASDIAELQVNLTKLGFSVQEIQQATPAINAFSIALGEDLARSAEIAAASVNAFSLSAKDTDRVVDVLSKTISSSAVSLEDWSVAVGKIGPIATQINLSIEDTAALFGKLRDTGLDASTATTSLRNVFLNLSDPTSKLNKALNGIGIEFGALAEKEGGLNATLIAFDALNAAGVDLADSVGLVERRTVAAFQSLLSNTDGIRELSVELNDASGATEEFSEKIEETYQVQLKELGSALNNVGIQLLDTIKGVAIPLINAFTGALNLLADNIDRVIATVITFGGALAALQATRIVGFIQNLIVQFRNLEKAVNLAKGSLGPLVAILFAVAEAGRIVAREFRETADAVNDLNDAIADFEGDGFVNSLQRATTEAIGAEVEIGKLTNRFKDYNDALNGTNEQQDQFVKETRKVFDELGSVTEQRIFAEGFKRELEEAEVAFADVSRKIEGFTELRNAVAASEIEDFVDVNSLRQAVPAAGLALDALQRLGAGAADLFKGKSSTEVIGEINVFLQENAAALEDVEGRLEFLRKFDFTVDADLDAILDGAGISRATTNIENIFNIRRRLLEEEERQQQEIAKNQEKSIDERIAADFRLTEIRKELSASVKDFAVDQERLRAQEEILADQNATARQKAVAAGRIESIKAEYREILDAIANGNDAIVAEAIQGGEEQVKAFRTLIDAAENDFEALQIAIQFTTDQESLEAERKALDAETEKLLQDRLNAERELQTQVFESRKQTLEIERDAFQATADEERVNVFIRLRALKEANDQRIKLLEEGRDRELALIEQQRRDLSVANIDEESRDILEKALAEEEAAIQESYDNRLQQQKDFNAESERSLIDFSEKQIKLARQTADALFEVGENIFEARLQNLQRQEELVLGQLDKEIEAAEGNEERAALLEQERARREEEFRQKRITEERREAAFQKAQAIFKIVANTAAAVSANFFFPPLIPFIVALGAAQIAAVASQPIPQFAEGTDSAPGGLALVGEEGREMIVTPRGQTFMTGNDGAQLMNLPKGSQVIPNDETEQMMDYANIKNMGDISDLESSKIINNNLEMNLDNVVDKLERHNKNLIEVVKNQEQHIFEVNSKGMKSFVKHRNGVTKYYEERYK